MPNGSGIVVLEYIQKMDSLPKIMMMTGYTEYSKDELMNKGALEVFSKHVDLENLIERVATIAES